MYIFNNLGVFYLSIWDISIPILVIKWFLECDVTYSTVPTARVGYSSYSGNYILLKCSFNQLENTINENKNRTKNKWLTDHQVVTWYPSLSHGETLHTLEKKHSASKRPHTDMDFTSYGKVKVMLHATSRLV